MKCKSTQLISRLFFALPMVFPSCGILAYSSSDLARLKETKNCERCDLREAALWNQDFSGANLRGADLRGAAIGMTNFSRANLTDADFSRAVFFKVDFTNSERDGLKDSRAIYVLCEGR